MRTSRSSSATRFGGFAVGYLAICTLVLANTVTRKRVATQMHRPRGRTESRLRQAGKTEPGIVMELQPDRFRRALLRRCWSTYSDSSFSRRIAIAFACCDSIFP